MDETQELKNKIDELEKRVDSLYGGSTMPEQFLNSLVRNGFLRHYRTLIGSGSAGNYYEILFVDHGAERHTLTSDVPGAYSKYTVSTSSDTFDAKQHGFQDDTVVRLLVGSEADAPPAPLVLSTAYYVVNSDTDDFQLSASLGGAAINITDTGTGNQFITRY